MHLRHGAVALAMWSAMACMAASTLPPQAASGDLLFRRGSENVSHLVQAVDGGSFSHVGMLIGSPGQWQVLHATPSERPGQPDAVVLDSLDFFLSPQRTRSYRLYQVSADRSARQQAVAWAQAQQGRPFHMQDAQQGIYCTTLVWQAWKQAGVEMNARFTEVELPILGGRYLLPSGLLHSSQLQALTPLLPVR